MKLFTRTRDEAVAEMFTYLPSGMTPDEILALAVARTLDGNKNRVVELFVDDSLHAILAAAPDKGGWRHFSPQVYDGWYLVDSGPYYEVYRQVQGVSPGSLRYARLKDAAHQFFQEVNFAPSLLSVPDREAEPDGTDSWDARVQWDGSAPGDRFTGGGEPAAFAMCTGFLEVIGYLNNEQANCYTNFFLRPLPPAADLLGALTLHFQNADSENLVLTGEQRAGRQWRIESREVKLQKAFIASTCLDWFFVSEHMTEMPRGGYRLGLVETFIDMLERAIGACVIHSIRIDPPGWYAIRWDIIAFERGESRFLLHFAHSN